MQALSPAYSLVSYRLSGGLRVMLTFSQEALLLLLLLDEEEGIFQSVGKNTLELAMAGAVLMELAFADRIDTDLEHLMVIDRAPTGNPLLDDVLERIAQGEFNNDTRGVDRDPGRGEDRLDSGACAGQPGQARHSETRGEATISGDDRTFVDFPFATLFFGGRQVAAQCEDAFRGCFGHGRDSRSPGYRLDRSRRRMRHPASTLYGRSRENRTPHWAAPQNGPDLPGNSEGDHGY